MSGEAELYSPQMVKQSYLPHGSKEASGMREGARKRMYPSLYAPSDLLLIAQKLFSDEKRSGISALLGIAV